VGLAMCVPGILLALGGAAVSAAGERRAAATV